MSLLIKMIRPNLDGLPAVALPAGYRLATAEEFDDPAAMWAEIVSASFPDTVWTVDYVHEHYMDKAQYDPSGVFFAMAGEEVASTAFAWRDEPRESTCGRVHWVATRPAHRRRGLASSVVVAVLRYFRDRGFASAFLETSPPLIPAIRAYFALGFEAEPRNQAERVAWEEVISKIRDLG